ncbi:hypothetical protein Ait01nite_010800 [Actinoplanes italicus]|nr:hypothetical protein Ait01nite_010800 [Actinoplanes italicus]
MSDSEGAGALGDIDDDAVVRGARGTAGADAIACSATGVRTSAGVSRICCQVPADEVPPGAETTTPATPASAMAAHVPMTMPVLRRMPLPYIRGPFRTCVTSHVRARRAA